MMKSGPNRMDENKIRQMLEDGMKVAEISRVLQIKADVVQTYTGKRRRGRPRLDEQPGASSAVSD